MIEKETGRPSTANMVWKPKGVLRDFVRYRDDSVCQDRVIWHVPFEGDVKPLLTLIIPTVDADRGGYFRTLMSQLCEQKMQAFELIVIKGDRRQGRAINIGAALAKGNTC